MYAFFKGKIESVLKDRVILEVNDIGYEIFVPEKNLKSLIESSSEVKIYTYLNVREDEMKLFGFLSREELEFFKKLISVSGVGPKVALGIISNIEASDMCVAIATENVTVLKTIPGIGPKMAQKIIFELKDKVLKDEMTNIKEKFVNKSLNNENIEEASTALQVLGYSQYQIKEALSSIDVSKDSVENIIRKVLNKMQKI
ncbi:MAG: Holliday junction branch migration protein RuvA [Clostridia bacterium]